MANGLVIYYSRSGNTRLMAEAIAESMDTSGLTTKCKSVADTSVDDLMAADAIVVGSPTYYGHMAAPLAQLFDDSVSKHGKLDGKIGAAFSSAANIGGGNETTIIGIIEAMLIAGLIVHGLFSEVLNRAPNLILSNVSYVKKVLFPLEILPGIAMGAALFHSTVSLTVLLVAYILFYGSLQWTAVFIPLVLLPLVILTLGLAWVLASLGVFLRDVGQTISIITLIMLFLSPVFYPLTALPHEYQILIMANPLTFIIEQTRQVLIWGRLPNWIGLGIYAMLATGVAWAGFAWFQKTRNGFADVL